MEKGFKIKLIKKMRKGIILAGGLGTRLLPLTKAISKQILPIYDKPMIYYPISNLIMSGIKDILIISTSEHISLFKKLLNKTLFLGLNIKFKIQKRPRGIAEALILGEKFLSGSDMCLILGDNIFFGENLEKKLKKASISKKQTIFVKKVKTPERYGVLQSKRNKPYKIIEKPKKHISNFAVTGIYFYNNKTIRIAKTLKPSKRNEIEITDLNQILLNKNLLNVEKLTNKEKWFDAGNHNDYLSTCNEVKYYEKIHNKLVGSIEFESLKQKFLTINMLKKTLNEDNFYSEKIIKYVNKNTL